jgi:hypothetical protein
VSCEEEDTCVSYEEEDACVPYEEEDSLKPNLYSPQAYFVYPENLLHIPLKDREITPI